MSTRRSGALRWIKSAAPVASGLGPKSEAAIPSSVRRRARRPRVRASGSVKAVSCRATAHPRVRRRSVPVSATPGFRHADLAVIAFAPMPSALNSTICARHSYFCCAFLPFDNTAKPIKVGLCDAGSHAVQLARRGSPIPKWWWFDSQTPPSEGQSLLSRRLKSPWESAPSRSHCPHMRAQFGPHLPYPRSRESRNF